MKPGVDDGAARVESDQREAEPEVGILDAFVIETYSVKRHNRPGRTGAPAV